MRLSRDSVVPVTAETAAARLDRTTATIRTWVTRFSARRLGTVGRVMYYDLNDLRVIEREIRHGHPIPPTPEDRARIRDACPLWLKERTRAAA